MLFFQKAGSASLWSNWGLKELPAVTSVCWTGDVNLPIWSTTLPPPPKKILIMCSRYKNTGREKQNSSFTSFCVQQGFNRMIQMNRNALFQGPRLTPGGTKTLQKMSSRGSRTWSGLPAVGPGCHAPWKTSNHRYWHRRIPTPSSHPQPGGQPCPWRGSRWRGLELTRYLTQAHVNQKRTFHFTA